MKQGKHKHRYAYIPVHIKKSHIQLAQIIGLHQRVLIQHQPCHQQYSRKIEILHVKDRDQA